MRLRENFGSRENNYFFFEFQIGSFDALIPRTNPFEPLVNQSTQWLTIKLCTLCGSLIVTNSRSTNRQIKNESFAGQFLYVFLYAYVCLPTLTLNGTFLLRISGSYSLNLFQMLFFSFFSWGGGGGGFLSNALLRKKVVDAVL